MSAADRFREVAEGDWNWKEKPDGPPSWDFALALSVIALAKQEHYRLDDGWCAHGVPECADLLAIEAFEA